MIVRTLLASFLLVTCLSLSAQPSAPAPPRFRVLALYENGGHHIEYSLRAKVWLDQLAADSNFSIDYSTHADTMTEALLANYQLIIQLDYVPYGWKPGTMTVFQNYIEQGRGGWIGFHHATLLGEFDGFPMWPWFSNFMGGIRWKDYIGRFAKATVHIEDHRHPVMKGIPDSFVVMKEEWYTYDKTPRPNVHVIANVDESSYQPDTTVKMGDHPVIWTNEKMRARNIYIFMGHSPILFDDPVYKKIFSNAIFWAASAATSRVATRSAPASRPPTSPPTSARSTSIVPALPAPSAIRPFRALAFFSTTVESDHVDFAHDAINFYSALASRKGFHFDTTTNWENCNAATLSTYQLVLWLNDFPHTEEQRSAFQTYMEQGGAWLGFHVAAYNDRGTKWPWFVQFLGGAVFYDNNWPPLGAKLIVDDNRHPVTRRMPLKYTAPINEWYGWRPSPRLDKDVKVLITLDPANYPLGKKDLIRSGDIPVVWTNTRYRMLYMNMGHGDKNFTSPLQNQLFEDAILWLGAPGHSPSDTGSRSAVTGSRPGAGSPISSDSTHAAPIIYVNQVGFEKDGPKMALIGMEKALEGKGEFGIVDVTSGKVEFSGVLGNPQHIDEWAPGTTFYQADFSSFKGPGKFRVSLASDGQSYHSEPFTIEENALARLTISSVIHYYNRQRANTPQELAADEHMRLYGSDKTVDIHGGWCDASGDVSKYFSHLAYANFMSPQQTPLVTWSMVSVNEGIPGLLTKWGIRDSLEAEALYGADYMMRALSKDDYFYMIVFSYFNKDPNARRIVGLLANSVTTDQYQCAFREGGGMAIAALARISQWKKDGAFTSGQYLAGAERAFAHLLINNTRYDDDGKENIIDDYCALMAATELWIATDSALYRDEARKRAHNLEARMSPRGYFIANDSTRPFWHASDAGLPVIALSRYLSKETDSDRRQHALEVIRHALDYNLNVTGNTSNPFGYARQSFLFKGAVKDGFFIPHDNETGWWWQGENARLSSLAAAALVGGRMVYPGSGGWGVKEPLARYAEQQVSWILGCNPYSRCFLYGWGKNNVPYMQSNFGHGSERGGISNGITGKKGNGDGSGIDFRTSDEGNEWRWTEQWIPHAAWFLQAAAAMAKE